jgi:hypothetical protein
MFYHHCSTTVPENLCPLHTVQMILISEYFLSTVREALMHRCWWFIREDFIVNICQFKPLQTKRRPSPYRAVNTFHLGYKNQSVYAVSGTSADLFI